MKVLHVCESHSSGVATSMYAMIRHAPWADHEVLVLRHRSHVGMASLARHVHAPEIRSRRDAVKAVSHAYRALGPDCVHAHSSYAGFFVRTAIAVPAAKVVYTPHCYAFERLDLSRAARGGIALVERTLGLRTGVTLAISRREAELAQRVAPRSRIVEAVNVPDLPPRLEQASDPRRGTVLTIAMVGRVSMQKDPDYFAEVVRRARDAGVDARWLWIGDGDACLVAGLREAGVEVTGWLSRERALSTLAMADVYFHSAAWEGMPVSLLEAAAMGLPVVARKIPALAQWDGPLADSPESVVRALVSLADPAARKAAAEMSASALASLDTSRVLRQALACAYEAAP